MPPPDPIVTTKLENGKKSNHKVNLGLILFYDLKKKFSAVSRV